jgi:hypothetical protein
MPIITNIIIIISLIVGLFGVLSPILIFKRQKTPYAGRKSMIMSGFCIWVAFSGLLLSLYLSKKTNTSILILGSLLFGGLIFIGNAISIFIKQQIDKLIKKNQNN